MMMVINQVTPVKEFTNTKKVAEFISYTVAQMQRPKQQKLCTEACHGDCLHPRLGNYSDSQVFRCH